MKGVLLKVGVQGQHCWTHAKSHNLVEKFPAAEDPGLISLSLMGAVPSNNSKDTMQEHPFHLNQILLQHRNDFLISELPKTSVPNRSTRKFPPE